MYKTNMNPQYLLHRCNFSPKSDVIKTLNQRIFQLPTVLPGNFLFANKIGQSYTMVSISVQDIYIIMTSYFDNVRVILSVIVYKWL